MQGVEVVFHTAAMLGTPRSPQQMKAVTAGGTSNVLQAAAKAGVRRVVHTSSVAALGVPESVAQPGGGRTPLLMDERHTWNYRPEWWAYGYAKYQAEMAVQQAVASGLDVVIVNPAVVLGAGDLNRVSGDIVVQVAHGRVPVTAPGGLNVVHIADVVRGHLAALERGRTGERYILGGDNLTIVRFLEIVAEVVKRQPPRWIAPAAITRLLASPVSAVQSWLPLPVGGDLLRKAGHYFYYDTLKARVELGLAHPLPARQAISDAYRWYEAKGLL
ncbi:MAG TPA: NAD-dependent epimerase/dehydratase family protein [Anaerolineales bacterium]